MARYSFVASCHDCSPIVCIIRVLMYLGRSTAGLSSFAVAIFNVDKAQLRETCKEACVGYSGYPYSSPSARNYIPLHYLGEAVLEVVKAYSKAGKAKRRAGNPNWF